MKLFIYPGQEILVAANAETKERGEEIIRQEVKKHKLEIGTEKIIESDIVEGVFYSEMRDY